jgi:hypothetical protein
MSKQTTPFSILFELFPLFDFKKYNFSIIMIGIEMKLNIPVHYKKRSVRVHFSKTIKGIHKKNWGGGGCARTIYSGGGDFPFIMGRPFFVDMALLVFFLS